VLRVVNRIPRFLVVAKNARSLISRSRTAGSAAAPLWPRGLGAT